MSNKAPIPGFEALIRSKEAARPLCFLILPTCANGLSVKKSENRA
jgi:hypothetical protein